MAYEITGKALMGTKEFISRLAHEVAWGNDTNLSHYQSDNQRAVHKE